MSKGFLTAKDKKRIPVVLSLNVASRIYHVIEKPYELVDTDRYIQDYRNLFYTVIATTIGSSIYTITNHIEDGSRYIVDPRPLYYEVIAATTSGGIYGIVDSINYKGAIG